MCFKREAIFFFIIRSAFADLSYNQALVSGQLYLKDVLSHVTYS